jgi:predicted nucleic acid-binding protein
VTAPDSSVLIAGFLPHHTFYAAARARLANVAAAGRLLGHAMAETYAVLTAPGAPHRSRTTAVTQYLAQFSAHEPFWLSGAQYADALAELERVGIEGGATYDALIGIAARNAGDRLISLDRRAATAYDRVGVDFELVG